mmetsp:Transcript_11148/g.16226  ORF Transcript_11148/g.16226 Transcript_11148/m.16226 type:complete len:202 (+) Transcript_11148:155-760(+)
MMPIVTVIPRLLDSMADAATAKPSGKLCTKRLTNNSMATLHAFRVSLVCKSFPVVHVDHALKLNGGVFFTLPLLLGERDCDCDCDFPFSAPRGTGDDTLRPRTTFIGLPSILSIKKGLVSSSSCRLHVPESLRLTLTLALAHDDSLQGLRSSKSFSSAFAPTKTLKLSEFINSSGSATNSRLSMKYNTQPRMKNDTLHNMV